MTKRILVPGFLMGWLCLPYQLDPTPRTDFDPDWPLLSPSVHRLQHRLRPGNHFVDADCFRRLPARPEL